MFTVFVTVREGSAGVRKRPVDEPLWFLDTTRRRPRWGLVVGPRTPTHLF